MLIFTENLAGGSRLKHQYFRSSASLAPPVRNATLDDLESLINLGYIFNVGTDVFSYPPPVTSQRNKLTNSGLASNPQKLKAASLIDVASSHSLNTDFVKDCFSVQLAISHPASLFRSDRCELKVCGVQSQSSFLPALYFAP